MPFERDSLEEARNAVTGHMSSKVDEDHHGIGYQKAIQMMDISDAMDEGPDILVEDDHPATPAPESPGATPPSDPVETDGGQRADLPTFESFDPDEHLEDDEDVVDDDSCEKCGGPLDDVDVLPDEVLERYPVLLKMAGICIPCSTDDDGEWTSPIEVFK